MQLREWNCENGIISIRSWGEVYGDDYNYGNVVKHFVLTFSVHNFIHAIYELDFEVVIHEKCRK